jgi:Fic family protein
MDPKNYTPTLFGKPTKEPGNKWSFWYFEPAEIPRELELNSVTVAALSKADASLGQLQGMGQLIKEPRLMIGPWLTSEAVASSRIEGTQTSLEEVLEAGISEERTASSNLDIAEVKTYIEATERGLELIKTLPITQRLILEIHQILLSGVRGSEKLPGEFRRSPVWMGSPTDSPDTAEFVPPLPQFLGELLSDWEKFVNEDSPLPSLIKCALMHYQFETIHPFLDGNGRIGRVLIGLMLQKEKRLTTPLLYLSGYLEDHRKEYYERLQAVREVGAIQQWLQFFLTAVSKQADDAVHRTGALIELRERYINESLRSRSRKGEIINLLFENPFITVKRVETKLGVSNQGARKIVADAEGLGWIKLIARKGFGGRYLWVAPQIHEIIVQKSSFES